MACLLKSIVAAPARERNSSTGHPFMPSGHRLLDERANLGFRRGVQRGEGPRDRVHVDALLASGVQDFAEAECDEVLVWFDVADVLAILHVKRQSPAYDRFERRCALPDDAVQLFSNLPILCGGIAELGKHGCVALLREHVSSSIAAVRERVVLLWANE